MEHSLNQMQSEVNRLGKLVAELTAQTVALKTEVAALKSKIVNPLNYQAIVVDRGGQLLIVHKGADADHDGHTSLAEAILAAKAFIEEKQLTSYKASALPTW